MSVCMMKPEPLAALADFTADALNMGYNYLGFDVPKRLAYSLLDCSRFGHFDAQKIYSRLYALNLAAYKGRWHHSPDEMPRDDAPEIECYKYKIHKIFEYDGHYVIEPWHYRIVKLLDFLIYQCDEPETNKTDLFQDLYNLRETLLDFIVSNSDGWQNAPAWGELN